MMDGIRGARQSGISLIEVVLAVGIGMLLVASGGFLFLGQIRGYKDIGSQARLQMMTKNAVQSLNTEIANTGACLNNKRYKFGMFADSLQFTYVDLKSRHCSATDTVTMSYFVASGTTGDTLIAKSICNSRPPNRAPLIKGLGAITIGFVYYDLNGAVTAAASKVKAVEFTINVKSQSGKNLFVRDRNPKIRVELLN
jgi:Tfp pilus assembly protein PilW